MKKRMVVGMLGVLLGLGTLTGCAGAEESMVTVQSETGESEGGDRVVLITMDSTDQHPTARIPYRRRWRMPKARAYT